MTGSLADQFVGAIANLIPDFEGGDERLGLAVSGGPDSIALLLLAHQIFPGRIAAATVDHQLRPEAKTEAKFVSDLCEKNDVPHETLSPTIPIRGNIQSEARKVRYGLLHSWMERRDIKWLATAHHADDQLETLVMRMLRGSGIDGMSAIRASRGYLIRPLLNMPKSQLEKYVKTCGITPVDDPSNRDQSFDRVRVRDALSQLQGFDISQASKSASALDDARTAISWMVEELADTHLKPLANGCSLDIRDFPHEIVRRLLLKALHICDPALSPRGEQLERTISALKNGQIVTIGDTLCKGGEIWTFEPAPKRRNR